MPVHPLAQRISSAPSAAEPDPQAEAQPREPSVGQAATQGQAPPGAWELDPWFPTWHRAMCRFWNPANKRLGVRDIQAALVLGAEAYQPDRMRLLVDYLRQAGAKRSTLRGRDLTPLARWIRDPGFRLPREAAPPDVLGGGLHALLERFKDKEQEHWIPAIARWIRMATAAEVPHRWAVKDGQTGETPLWAAQLIEDLNAPAPAPITWRDLPAEERQALVTRIAAVQNLSLTIALLSSFPAEDLGLDTHWGPIVRATWGRKVVPLPDRLVAQTPALARWWPKVGGTAGVWMGIGERADWTQEGVAAMVEGDDGLDQLAYIRDTIEPPVTVLTALLEKYDIKEAMDWEHVLRFARRRDRREGHEQQSPVDAMIPLLGRLLNRDMLRCRTTAELLDRIGPVTLEQCLKTPAWFAALQQEARTRLVAVSPPWLRELFWDRLLHERGLQTLPRDPQATATTEGNAQDAQETKTATHPPMEEGVPSLDSTRADGPEKAGGAQRPISPGEGVLHAAVPTARITTSGVTGTAGPSPGLDDAGRATQRKSHVRSRGGRR